MDELALVSRGNVKLLTIPVASRHFNSLRVWYRYVWCLDTLISIPFDCCRYYVQPQWVFDCVNARRLLPLGDYFPGVDLPPHLSPFVDDNTGDYVPPERRRMLEGILQFQ